MSRSLSRILHGLASAVTAGRSDKRRAMTYSRLIERLDRSVRAEVATAHGTLKVLTLRGPHLAAAAVGFEAEEPELLAWMDTFRPGETLWDVGAATGLFSMYAALRGVEVFAFEPKATSFGVLAEHLALNGLGEKVFPVCAAFSDETALARIQIWEMAPGTAGNSLDGTEDQFGHAARGFPQGVPVWRIDDFRAAWGLKPPEHLKVDVDGIEGPILRGGAETLKSVRSVLVEVEGRNAEEAASRIDPPLLAAGLVEDLSVRGAGSGRNRLYLRPAA